MIFFFKMVIIYKFKMVLIELLNHVHEKIIFGMTCMRVITKVSILCFFFVAWTIFYYNINRKTSTTVKTSKFTRYIFQDIQCKHFLTNHS